VSNQDWNEHAYPLQQISIQLQGTRHSDRTAIIDQLETVIARLRAGDVRGHDHGILMGLMAANREQGAIWQ